MWVGKTISRFALYELKTLNSVYLLDFIAQTLILIYCFTNLRIVSMLDLRKLLIPCM